MRKLLLIPILVIFYSCIKTNEEKMLYQYQKEKFISDFNVDIEDLDLDIKSMQRVKDITGTDSDLYFKGILADLWFGKGYNEKQRDTLKLDYVKSELQKKINESKKIFNEYLDLQLLYAKGGNSLGVMRTKIQRKEVQGEIIKYSKKMEEAVIIGNKISRFEKIDNKVISTQYIATYTVKNPSMSNVKQTFTKYFFTNVDNSAVIMDKPIDQ